MPSAGKRALALLLCLTTLSALSGCMSAELVAGRLTETVLPPTHAHCGGCADDCPYAERFDKPFYPRAVSGSFPRTDPVG